MNDEKETVKGDGGPERLGEEEIKTLCDELEEIRKEADLVRGRRQKAEEIRYCIWDGQAADGRKHREEKEGKEPFPFEGASDCRLRLADMAVTERVIMQVSAAMRAKVKIRGTDIRDEAYARRMEMLLRWVLNTQWGSEYRRELTRLSQYQQADSPACAVLGVYWDQQAALEMKTIRLVELAMTLKQLFPELTGEDLAALPEMVMDPEQEEQISDWIRELMPEVSAKRARKMVSELREKGEAEFPHPYLRINLPKLRAHRVMEDIFFKGSATDLQRTPCIIVPEWLTEAELKGRIKTEGYEESFVEEALKHKGKSTVLQARDMELLRVSGDYSQENAERDPDEHKDEVEILTAYQKLANEEDVSGVFVSVFHHAVKDQAARPRTLLGYQHGKYPFVFFPREILNSRLQDSRGLPELLMSEQEGMKLCEDMHFDFNQLTTVPPIRRPMNRPRLDFIISPLGQIKERRPGEVSYMPPPAQPIANEKQQREIRRRVDEYLGRLNPEVAPQLNVMHSQWVVDLFLDSLRDALTMVLQLCQQYITDEQLQRIVGIAGDPQLRSRREIQGQFDLQITFDVRDLDLAYLKELAATLAQMVLPMDTQATVMRDRLVARLFAAIDPTLAQETLQPAAAASAKEIDEEEQAFAKIAAGIEPPMITQGQNYPLRLQVLQGIGQKNPEAIGRLGEVSRQILAKRMQFLAFQVQQAQNAMIGRTGAAPVLPQMGPRPGMPAGAPGGGQGQ